MGTLGIDWAIMPSSAWKSTSLLFCRRQNSLLMAAGWTNESYFSTLIEEIFLFLPRPPLLLLPLRPLKRAMHSLRATAATDWYFFFGVSTKGTETMTPIVLTSTGTYKLVFGQLWYIFRLNSFGSKFRGYKRLELEVLQNTLHDIFFLHKLIGMVACSRPNMVKNANFRGLCRIWEFLPTLLGIINLPPTQPRFLGSAASLAIKLDSKFSWC